MLSNMSSRVFNALAAVTVAIPLLAWSNILPVHNVRASTLEFFHEIDYTQNQSTQYTAVPGTATLVWQEQSLQGFGNVRTQIPDTKGSTAPQFELKLVRITSSNANYINGEWDVFKNGDPTCAGCKGQFYVSSPGDNPQYLKGYVNNDKVGYSFMGYLNPNTRHDY